MSFLLDDWKTSVFQEEREHIPTALQVSSPNMLVLLNTNFIYYKSPNRVLFSVAATFFIGNE